MGRKIASKSLEELRLSGREVTVQVLAQLLEVEDDADLPITSTVACKQIFSVKYGVVEYVAWDRHRANAELLPNPIRYTYLKASCFSVEKELRISLSAIGIGNFALNDGEFIVFPTGLQVQFDLRAAIAGGAIQQILLGPDCDATFLHAELARLGIGPAPPVA